MEDRQLLAADPVVFPIPDVTIPTFDGPRNVGTVQAFNFSESEAADESGLNDTIFSADFVPLGTGAGEEDTIDITGNAGITIETEAIPLPDGTFVPATFRTDLDTYAFDLRAGDILDIAVLGAGGSFTVLFEDGQFWFGIDDSQAALANGYTGGSPLQVTGNATYAQVVPEDGRYFLTIPPISTAGQYTVGLRAYRPVVESLPIGTQQIIFLDFDGAIVPQTVLDDGTGVPQTNIFRIPSLQDSLPLLGLDDVTPDGVDDLIDQTIEEVERQFDFLGIAGNAGDYDRTGVPGDFGITILNSRDHVDPGPNALVTRVLIGGTIANIGLPAGVLGVSTTLDVGNFSMDDVVFVALDAITAVAQSTPIANSSSVVDASADVMAFIITHEIGHSLGMRHTEDGNNVDSIADPIIFSPVGNDGIFGTLDDLEANFVDDQFRALEGIFGTYFVVDGLANTLVTGTSGGGISGTVFNDANADGINSLEAGLAGVTVFADINGNGILEVTEPSAVSAADGSFTLAAAAGNFTIIAITPDQFAPTTATSLSAAVTLGGSTTGLVFGFNQVIADITGTKFADIDGDGIFDTNEVGIGGVFVYLDLDGDDRPDLGEPGGETNADGTYSLNFPGPGTYTIREVVGPGFIQTFPASGEHTVVFDGTNLTENFNFGNQPSRDFGDAPDSYLTTLASGGPSHGLATGLSLGVEIDRDSDGEPSVDALGDDNQGRLDFSGNVVDDEDGVNQTSALGPGSVGSIEVTTTNESGTSAFLTGWIDFNADGDFADAGEQIIDDLLVGTAVSNLTFNVPADAAVGETFARFRYSQSAGLGFGGDADSGEVEDYQFVITGSGEIADDDVFSVSRNSQANVLDVLGNDFETPNNQLTITSRDLQGTQGAVIISADGRFITYTPPNGFVGLDSFGYTVTNELGQTATARVNVNVSFQSANPIAIDDSFNVPQGSSNRALNVLDNDVPSVFGGLSITSVTAGDQGGTITIAGGGQSRSIHAASWI